MSIQAAVMDRNKFSISYRKCEAIHGRQPSELDIERSWNRYEKIVLKGK